MKKVVIIGAGPAGLTAAYELLKQSSDYQVTILEESDAIGGISKTIKYHGNRMDIGGHRFFSKDPNVTKFWNDLMPTQGSNSFDDILLNRSKPLVEGGPDPEKTDRVMLVRHRVSRIYYLKKFFDYPISMKMQTFKNMGLARTIKAGFSYMKTTVHKKEETSLENFYINRFGKELYSMFFEKYTEKLWGRHPREISAEWGAQRVKGLSIKAVLKDMFSKVLPKSKNKKRKVETSLIEEFFYPKFGPGQLWETVADEVINMGGIILKNSKVVQVNTENNRIISLGYEQEQALKTIEGDLFISSMPIKDLIESMGQAVPETIQTIATGLPYRDFTTIGILVNKLNLKNQTTIKTLGNIVPDCWIYIQDEGVKLGRIQIFNNWSPYMVKDAVNTVWIGLEYFCNEGDSFWKLSDEDCVNFAVDELIKIGVISHKNEVLDSHRERVKKAYPAYFDTYAQFDQVKTYLDAFDNLFCVGRNGQHRYNNMDHSMVTSFETVKNILTDQKLKENIWNVNTEKEYHEEKKQ